MENRAPDLFTDLFTDPNPVTPIADGLVRRESDQPEHDLRRAASHPDTLNRSSCMNLRYHEAAPGRGTRSCYPLKDFFVVSLYEPAADRIHLFNGRFQWALLPILPRHA